MAYQIYCPSCRAANPPEARFCSNCGNPFVTVTAGPPSPLPKAEILNDILRVGRKKWRSWGLIKKGIASIVAIFLLFAVLGAIGAVINPHAGEPTREATVTATTPMQSKSIPAPTEQPIGPEKLTQARLAAGEASFTSKGYTFTKHLAYDHTDSDGNLVYKAEMTTPDGYSQTLDLTVYKDQTSADAGLTQAVYILNTLGFNGQYNDAYSWTGIMLYHGTPVGGGAVESSDGAPYMVSVFFLL